LGFGFLGFGIFNMRANSLAAFLIFLPLIASAQTRVAPEFQITKITRNLIPTPQFAYAGAGQNQTSQRDPWLEVEVEFKATPNGLLQYLPLVFVR
jgi:hypothetical protein